jgi:DNA repair protein RecO (recombination protein O)
MGTPTTDLGYVLHLRPYRETSALVELLTRQGGRVAAVAHGVRGPRRRLVLPTFVRCWLSLAGRGELRTLRGAEATEARWLSGRPLAAGLYANELLVRLLPRDDADGAVFDAYAALLEGLSGDFAVVLRRFERRLLDALGYGVDYANALDTGEPVMPAARYRLHGAEGFVADADGSFTGAALLRVAAQDLAGVDAMRVARAVTRALLAAHLSGPPRSRSLLRPPRDEPA